MGKTVVVVCYVLAMVAVVVGADILFFRHHALERLMVNVGIVLVFAAFYLTFLKRPWAQSRCNWHLYSVLRILDDEKTSRDWSLTPAGVINDAPVGVERGGITSVQIESGHDVKGFQQSDQLGPRRA